MEHDITVFLSGFFTAVILFCGLAQVRRPWR
jgi:hypothetical protein